MKELRKILELNCSGVLEGTFSTNMPILGITKALTKKGYVENIDIRLGFGNSKVGIAEKRFEKLEGKVNEEKENEIILSLDKNKKFLIYLAFKDIKTLFGNFTAVLKK